MCSVVSHSFLSSNIFLAHVAHILSNPFATPSSSVLYMVKGKHIARSLRPNPKKTKNSAKRNHRTSTSKTMNQQCPTASRSKRAAVVATCYISDRGVVQATATAPPDMADQCSRWSLPQRRLAKPIQSDLPRRLPP
jgi:hypothetical protein